MAFSAQIGSVLLTAAYGGVSLQLQVADGTLRAEWECSPYSDSRMAFSAQIGSVLLVAAYGSVLLAAAYGSVLLILISRMAFSAHFLKR